MAQPTKPGNTERGWNDPPVLLHGNSLAKPPPNPGQNLPKLTRLNKRIAHPGIFSGGDPSCPKTGDGKPPRMVCPQKMSPSLSSAPPFTSSASPCTNTNNAVSLPQAVPSPSSLASPPAFESSSVNGVILLPPASSTDIPKFTAPIIVPTMSPKEDCPLTKGSVATNPITNLPVNTEAINDDTPIPDFDNDEQMYHFVITRLRKTCFSCAETVQPRVTDDINRKLDIFSNMWKDGKISYPVKSSMARLATALHRRKCDVAHQIHLALMMDYVSEVGQWMVGIKRLIQEARNTEAPLSPSDSTVPNLFHTVDNQVEHLTNDIITEKTDGMLQHLPNNIQTREERQLTANVPENDAVQITTYRQSDSPATIEATTIE